MIGDNGLSVPVQFLPPRSRADSLLPWVVPDHQSSKREERAVTPKPTGKPAEQS